MYKWFLILGSIGCAPLGLFVFIYGTDSTFGRVSMAVITIVCSMGAIRGLVDLIRNIDKAGVRIFSTSTNDEHPRIQFGRTETTFSYFSRGHFLTYGCLLSIVIGWAMMAASIVVIVILLMELCSSLHLLPLNLHFQPPALIRFVFAGLAIVLGAWSWIFLRYVPRQLTRYIEKFSPAHGKDVNEANSITRQP